MHPKRLPDVQRPLSLSLALLLLVSSVSLSVSRHFCMGELKSVALFAEAEACHQEATPSCPLHAKATKKGCCDDDHELVEADDDRQVVDVPVLPTPVWGVPTLPAPRFPEFALHLRARPNKTFENYRPPPLLIDVPRRFQVFRI